ncbi:MAG: histidine phosphatase family protein [Kofleriaceae bacterium]
MQVYLIRHAEAVDETVSRRDPVRNLSLHGRDQARALGDRLRWHDCTPTHVWTSPLVRTVQTAELIEASVACGVAVEAMPQLAPEGSPREVVAALRALPADARVFVVGHEPSLSSIGELLTGGELEALGKAHAVRIDDAEVRWRVAWDADAPTPNR